MILEPDQDILILINLNFFKTFIFLFSRLLLLSNREYLSIAFLIFVFKSVNIASNVKDNFSSEGGRMTLKILELGNDFRRQIFSYGTRHIYKKASSFRILILFFLPIFNYS